MAITEFAPAKVNLTLYVTGRRDDGYHLLDSLVVFAGVGDRVTVAPSDSLRLTVDGPFAVGVPTDERNLVMRAARLLSSDATAHIHLTKELPHGAGIGGGSSDAAATLRALSKLWNLPLPSDRDTLFLGADVPVCMHGPRPMIMAGIGEVLAPAPPLPHAWLVLVNPGVTVPTGDVFAVLRERYGLNELATGQLDELAAAHDAQAFADWLKGQHNELAKCAGEFAPQIGTILDLFEQMESCLDTDMSGSGSTCWGLFADETSARKAASHIAEAHADWWVRAAPILTAS